MRTGGAWAVKGLSMEKWLCLGSMAISGLLLVLFILDLTIGMPFGGHWKVVKILGVISCGLILYMGWDAFKDWR